MSYVAKDFKLYIFKLFIRAKRERAIDKQNKRTKIVHATTDSTKRKWLRCQVAYETIENSRTESLFMQNTCLAVRKMACSPFEWNETEQ